MLKCFTLVLIGSLVTATVHAQEIQTFKDAKLLVQKSDGKADRQDAAVRLNTDSFLVLTKDQKYRLKALAYSDIKSAQYSYSKSPRWKSGIGVAVVAGVFALPLFFMKGKRHWLTVTGTGDYAVLQLDKSNYKMILASLESRSGVTVETVKDDK